MQTIGVVASPEMFHDASALSMKSWYLDQTLVLILMSSSVVEVVGDLPNNILIESIHGNLTLHC